MTAHRGAEWDLVEAAQAGDRDAFGHLYARYANQVSGFVRSRTGDRALADDLTSETFLRALRRIDSVSYQGRDAGAWFTTIARNLVLDHVKSSRHRLERPTAQMRDADDRHDGPEQAVIRKETAAQVRHCVGLLPPDQQECIRLRYFQDLSVAATAASMGRSEGAVKALTHRALQQLRARATSDVGPVPPARHRGTAGRELPAHRDCFAGTLTPVDPLVRARRAVGVVQQRRAGDRQRAEADRSQRSARWHADDHAAQCRLTREHAEDRGGPALTAEVATA